MEAVQTATNLRKVLAYHSTRPVEFVKHWLGAEPEPEQAKMLDALVDGNWVVVRSGHGVGKSAALAWAILWWMTTHYRCRIPCTAPTQHQLEDILWPEVAKWLRKSALTEFIQWTKTRLWVKGYEEEWFAVPRSCSIPENLQGFHGDYVLFVVDEAAGVEEDIWPVVLGALSTFGGKLIMAGNPTKISGTFYDAFSKDRELYKSFRFSSAESKLVSPNYIEQIARKYGRDSNVYAVRVLGDFPGSEPDTLIPLSDVEKAVARRLSEQGIIELGVDPARYGDDESVVAVRIGAVVRDPVAFTGINTTRLTGEVNHIVRELRKEFPEYVEAISVKVDDTGLGGGVTDQLQEFEDELNLNIVPVNNGSSSSTPDHDDYGTQLWCELKDVIDEVQLPDDPELIKQLSTRKYGIRPNGKLKVERKEDMKKRGLHSPDRADAVVLAFASGVRVSVGVA